MAKQYGLILPATKNPQKVKPVFNSSRNVFGGDSDSDEDTPIPKQKQPMIRPSDTTKRQARLAQQKALQEDPTVYQYDELYDDMSSKKDEEKNLAKVEKKPRYIEKLLDAANKRKRENERRLERQVQKERESEGDQFADKEAFVTSAYKKKLEEMRQEEEREKREEYLEAIGDVTKQKDLDGFYRHLYEQRLQPEKCSERLQKQTSNTNEGKEDEKEVVTETKGEKRKSDDNSLSQSKKQRIYRKRNVSNSLNEENNSDSNNEDTEKDEINKVTVEDLKAGNRPQTHLQSNLDADSDFSIDSSSSEDEEETKANVLPPKDGVGVTENVEDVTVENGNFKVPAPVDKEKIKAEPEVPVTKVETVEEKPKVDIWKKRTVGVVFDEALKRYYERKASRGR